MLRLTLTFLLINTIFLFVILAQKDFELIILHTSNIRSRYEETRDAKTGKLTGGCARIAHIIKEARRAYKNGTGPPVLYLDAGDIFTGSVWFTVHKEKMASEIMNVLNPDAVCVGNHEFDYGIEKLLPFSNNAAFPILASNLNLSDANTPEAIALQKLLKDSLILELNKAGTTIKVGIVSYLLTDVRYMSDIGNIEVLDEVATVKRIAKDLTQQGAQLIIALGHSRYRIDKRIAKSVEEVDLVLGGHGHVLQWNDDQRGTQNKRDSYPKMIKQKHGKSVPLLQGFAHSKYMGRIFVTCDKNGNVKEIIPKPIFLDQSIDQDPEILNVIEKFRPGIIALNTTVIGRSKVLLDGISCRTQECNFGNLAMDAFIKYRASRYNGSDWTDTPVALMNSGALRKTINASLRGNNVYKADIISAIPYSQLLYIVELTGKHLQRTLEISAKEITRGGFLLTSGLKVVLYRDKRSLHYVNSIQVRCASCEVPNYLPIEDDALYKVVATQFLINGGDGHTILRDNRRALTPISALDVDAIFEYFNRTEVVMPEMDERVIIEDNGQNSVRIGSSPPLPLLFSLLLIFIIYII